MLYKPGVDFQETSRSGTGRRVSLFFSLLLIYFVPKIYFMVVVVVVFFVVFMVQSWGLMSSGVIQHIGDKKLFMFVGDLLVVFQ